MRKLLKIFLLVAIVLLNAIALLHSGQKEGVQDRPTVAKPLRVQLNEVPFVILPNLVKA